MTAAFVEKLLVLRDRVDRVLALAPAGAVPARLADELAKAVRDIDADLRIHEAHAEAGR